MRLVRKFVAIVLLALWLPAVAHCELADLGWLPSASRDADCKAGACTKDGCGVLEKGGMQVDTTVLKAPTPSVSCECFICLHSALTEVFAEQEPALPKFDRPLDWFTSWRFTQRAALPARAPSSVIG